MSKTLLTAIVFFCATSACFSQTLFTYGDNKADAKEFLRAFSKNNQQPAASKKKAMEEYLDLYINSRLKIREAYARGFDSLPQIRNEVENLRGQIIESYLSDPNAITRLSKEAFQRSQKDIHAAHIFVAFTTNTGLVDTAAAGQKLNDIMKRLAKGEDFLAVATKYSDDPGAATNHGDLDYITVFTLPYELENVIYNTPIGKYSKPHASKAGYHIFRNLGERRAKGKIKLQQILLAFPPGIGESGKKDLARLADSLYKQILKGADFGQLASKYSNDIISASNQGNIPDVGVGQYEPDFEKMVWLLAKDGAVSKPFLSSHGYHIVKRVSVTPIVTNPADKANMTAIEQRVKSDDRWKTAKDFIYEQVKNKAGVKRLPYNESALYALSDSMLDGRPALNGRNMSTSTGLFTIGKKTYTVVNWIAYAQGYRYKSDRSGLKTYPDLMDEFVKYSMYQYYRDYLEDFNEEFRNQMTEFKDGNMFFEIMQQEVWNKAQTDSLALLALFQKNLSQYDWKKSADAAIFFCSDETAAKTLHEQLKKNPTSWRSAVQKLNDRVVADSSRYEWSQLPGLGTIVPKDGMVTAVTMNKSDNSASFSYINKVYTQPSHRSFDEAKGLVMNDYQTILEEEWVKSLRKKYPVKVDQAVFEAISK